MWCRVVTCGRVPNEEFEGPVCLGRKQCKMVSRPWDQRIQRDSQLWERRIEKVSESQVENADRKRRLKSHWRD